MKREEDGMKKTTNFIISFDILSSILFSSNSNPFPRNWLSYLLLNTQLLAYLNDLDGKNIQLFDTETSKKKPFKRIQANNQKDFE